MSNYKQIILEALRKVVSEPYYEVVHDMHEVALCHRLAVNLEKSGKFDHYLIDCDYNRDKKDVKRTRKGKNKTCGFRPDIVVHKRGSKVRTLILLKIFAISIYEPLSPPQSPASPN